MAATPKPARYPALSHRNFTLIWSGLIVSNMGTWMQNVAQSWLIYKMTGNDPLFLGYLGLAFALPMTLLPPLGGVVVDRVNRIQLLYVTQTGAALNAALLAALVWTNLVQPWHILVAAFVQALLLAFDNPARQSLIPELVPRQDLLNALSLNSATYTGAALIGPALAGLLLGYTDAGWLYLLNAVSYAAVIFALLSMRNLPPYTPPSTTIRAALFGGAAFIWRNKLVLLMLVLSALSALFGRSYQQLLPVFADDVWHVGSGGYGQLLSAIGGGALLGAFAMSSTRDLKAHGKVLVVSGLVFCVTLALFAFSPYFSWGVVLLVIVGLAATVFTTMMATTVQLRTPNEVRGRVMSFYAATLIGLPSLGSLGVAALAKTLAAGQGDAVGAPRAIVLGAVVVAVVILVATPVAFSIQAPSREMVGGPGKA